MKAETPVEALSSAVAKFGTQARFANALSKRTSTVVSPARVWNWLNRDGGAPSELCPDIEALSGICCERLRPDVNWAVLRGGQGGHDTSVLAESTRG